MRLAIGCAAALALALAPAAPAAKKISLQLPKAGQASALRFTVTVKKGKKAPKPRITGKLPAGTGAAVAVRKGKKPRTFNELLVVMRRGAAGRRGPVAHAAQDFGFNATNVTLPGLTNLGVTGAQREVGFLNTTLPTSFCGFSTASPVAAKGLLAGATNRNGFSALLDAGCGHADLPGAQGYLCSYAMTGCAPGPGGPVAPNFTFSPGPTFTPGAGVTDVAAGSVNGDSFPDLITGGSDGLMFFPGGAGTIGSPTTIPSSRPQDFVGIGDVTGDGKPDPVGVSSSQGVVEAFLGDGAGGFTPGPPFIFTSGAPLRGLTISDLNGDSRADVVVGQNDGQAAVLIGQAGGGFAGQDFPVGNGGALFSLAVADFNADGSPDIVVVGAGTTPFVGSLINHKDGTFGTPATSNLTGAPNDVAAGDLNGDGKPDVAVSEDGAIQLFPSVGDGTFGPPTNLTFTGGVAVAVGDVNGDGVTDVLALNRGAGTVATWLGQAGAGLAGYQSPLSSAVGANPVAMSLLNFNGDAKADLTVVNNNQSGGIYVSAP